MKRVIGLLTFGLGILLLVMAPVVRFVVAPRLLKAPIDTNVTLPHGGGPFTYLSAADGGEIQLPYVAVSRHIYANPELSNDDVAVYEEALCLTRDDEKQQLGCTEGSDPRTIANYYSSFAFDRKTGLAVNGAVCGKDGKSDCNNRYTAYEGQPEDEQKTQISGIGPIFPMNTEKKTYQYWDDPSGRAWPMEFAGTETVGGLETYKFVQKIVDAEATTNGLGSLYSNTRTLWIEPRTGATIHGQEEIDQRLTGEEPGKSGLNPALKGKTALKGTLKFTQEAIDTQAKQAKDGIKSIDMITKWLPLGLLVLGALLTLLGLLLQRDRRREPGTAAPLGRRIAAEPRGRRIAEPAGRRIAEPAGRRD